LKRSGGNSPPRLEDFVFFIERPLGKKVGLALREQGLRVVLHTEKLKDDALDEEYLALCAERGWVVITADSDVHTKVNQRLLVKNGRLRVFRLTRNHWRWQEKVEAFTLAIPAMLRLLRRTPAPFIARIDRKGNITSKDTLEKAPG
jgi:PIN domain-containing protein